MARATGALRWVLVVAAALVVVVVVAILLLTRTEFGVERSGRFVIERLRSSIHGELEVGQVTSGGLLSGVTLHDIAIRDIEGRPFLAADSARLAYSIRTLISGDLVFDRLFLYSPEIHLERLPGREEWNYEGIFPGDTATAADTADAPGLVLIRDATVADGRVFVRIPWEPEDPEEAADTARLILEEVPGGIARVMRFEDVDGRVPRIIWEAPGEEGRLVQIGEMSARAYIWEDPLDLRHAEGTLTIRDSLLAFDFPDVRLPESRLSVVGTIVVGEEEPRYDLQAEGEGLAFQDFQWLYPKLPEEGGGRLQFRLQTRDDGSLLFLARNARLRSGGTEVAGSFGVVSGDSVYFTNVELEATPIELELLRSILPGDLPLEGLLIGTVEVEGPISALRTRGDMRYRRFVLGEGAESEVRWSGTVRAARPFGVRRLEAAVRRMELAQVAQFFPELRVRGVATGDLKANGSLERGLDVSGNLRLERGGLASAVRGSGSFAVGGDRSRFDLRLDAEPVVLELLAEQFPVLARITGEARGPVVVSGSLDDLRVDADIVTPAGTVEVEGTLALDGPEPVFRLSGGVAGFQLDRVVDGMPETAVTGRFELEGRGGRGGRLEEAEARALVELQSARVAGIQVYHGTMRGGLVEGILALDSASLNSEVGEVTAVGTFGVVDGREGTLEFHVRRGTLSPLEPVLFPEVVATDFGLAVEPLVSGAVTAEAALRGGFDRWTLTGSLTGGRLVYDRARATLVSADLEWTSEGVVEIGATVDSLRLDRRLLPHIRTTARYDGRAGEIVAAGRGVGRQALDLAGSFERIEGGAAFRVAQLSVATGNGRWALADTAGGSVSRGGIRVDPLVLVRAPSGSRVRLAGVLPWRLPGETGTLAADFSAELDRVRIDEVLRLAQMDTVVDGLVTGDVRVRGSALAPVMEGRLSVSGFRYDEAVLDSLTGEAAYSDRVLTARVAGWRGADAIVEGEGSVPLNMALAEVMERRLDSAMDLRLRADSVPGGLVGFLAPGFTGITGWVDGEVLVGGTPLEPVYRGELRLTDGRGRFDPAGVVYRDVNAVAALNGRSLLTVDAGFRTESGTGRLRGSVDFTTPRDPGFDLEIVARRLDAVRRRDVSAIADGQLHLGGRYTRPVLSTPSGTPLRLVQGYLDIGEIWRQYRIVQLDTSLFQVIDTAQVSFRPQAASPFLQNLVVSGASLALDRDFWLRSRELNVEVIGELAVNLDRQAEDIRLTGELQALRGTYELQLLQTGLPGRRFDIRSGTIEFVGTPGIDPNLAIAAGYRVRRSLGDPIDVLASVSGTLQSPRVQLSSDSDPPVSESDLASYLIFGRSSLELSQSETDLVSTGLGVFRPVISGLASTTLQSVAASLGLPVDYLALSQPEYGLGDYALQRYGAPGLFRDTQLEVGVYAWRELFLVGSVRLATSEEQSFRPRWGTRLEYRFRPTWTGEAYLEDRFARTPSFGYDEIEDRTVWGLSLFREWGY